MTTPDQPPAILLFLKAPVPGAVKTRLARDVGEVAACEIYCDLVARQVGALPEGWPVEIHFTPASAAQEFKDCFAPRFACFAQTEGDLGDRLREATDAAFKRGHRRVLLIGGDCPALDGRILHAAADLLDAGKDAVIGPARDGGYYLLGLNKFSPFLFREIPWSGPDVARVTAERANAADLLLGWLEELEDVDDLASYRRAVAAGYLKRLAPSANAPILYRE
jgi:uncharacterized protein